MEYREFGKDRENTVILLHGGGLCWWNYREAAKLLEDDFHVILPVLDGHAGADRPFVSIEENALGIIEFMDRELGGHALFIGGLSLGGQILLEMLARRRGICSFALAESASVIPSGLTARMTGPAVSCSYPLVKRKSFAQAQFSSLHINDGLFEDYWRDSRHIAKEDMISFIKASAGYRLDGRIGETEAKVFVRYGEKERRVIKKSTEKIKEAVPGCSIRALTGMRHGEFSLNRPDLYAEEVRKIIQGGYRDLP